MKKIISEAIRAGRAITYGTYRSGWGGNVSIN